jgi:predicted membrane channel-forming protein YqfA (hemolysin III family)
MRENARFFVLIGVAAVIIGAFVVPYLRDTGHVLLIIPIVLFFVGLGIYGCHNPAPRHRKKDSPSKQV